MKKIHLFLYENIKEILLIITSVHPMRKEAVKKFISKANCNWNIVEKLIRDGLLVEIKKDGEIFYLRKMH